MTEADFRARQRVEVNDSGSDHADGVYNGFRDDALIWLSKAVPQDRSASLSIISGTLSYPRPTRFITMTNSEMTFSRGLEVPKYRIETATYAVLRDGVDFVLSGSTIVFASDPLVTAAWTAYYGGSYLITDLPDEWVSIVLDFATARMYELKAARAAEYFQYSMGPESVDRNAESGKWLKLRDARLARANAELSKIAFTESLYGTIRIDRA